MIDKRGVDLKFEHKNNFNLQKKAGIFFTNLWLNLKMFSTRDVSHLLACLLKI